MANLSTEFDREFKVNKGEWTTVGGELTFQFAGHSHKLTRIGQQPLNGIYLNVINSEGEQEEVMEYFRPNEPVVWTWGAYQFEQRGYEFGNFAVMVVRKLN